MKFLVIDTNVPVVANGRNTNASPQCRSKTLIALMDVIKSKGIIIDDTGEMLEEYKRYCKPKGEPGIGDRFLRELLLNYSKKIKRITLEKDESGNYRDFPSDGDLANFDLSDRKFAAAARKAKIPVLNSTDSDWLDHYPALRRNGIEVHFVCGCDSNTWLDPEQPVR